MKQQVEAFEETKKELAYIFTNFINIFLKILLLDLMYFSKIHFKSCRF